MEKKTNSECGCTMCKIQEILRKYDETGQLSEAISAFGGPDRDCSCARCQRHFYIEDDRPRIEMVFEDDEPPLFVLRPQHHRAVDKLLSLYDEKESAAKDLVLFRKIIEENDDTILDGISNDGINWIKENACKAVRIVLADGGKNASKIDDEVNTVQDLIALLAGTKSFENKKLNENLSLIRDLMVDGHQVSEIEEAIEKAKAEMPEELRDATAPLRIEIPIEELVNWATEKYAC